jgi:hypothetical protein
MGVSSVSIRIRIIIVEHNGKMMAKNKKHERLNEIKELIQSFCDLHLTEELTGYAFKLCDKLGRKRTSVITSGGKEIWAASIVYVIARLNFLFDPKSETHITPDVICDHFGTKKSTIGNKATQVEKACGLGLGAEGYCNPAITDAFTFVQTPDGIVIPQSMLNHREIIYEFVEGEEAEELKKRLAEENRRKQREIEEKKERRKEINRKIAEQKRIRRPETTISLSCFKSNGIANLSIKAFTPSYIIFAYHRALDKITYPVACPHICSFPSLSILSS